MKIRVSALPDMRANPFRIFSVGVALSASVAVSACAGDGVYKVSPPDQPVPAVYFGIHNHRFHNQSLQPQGAFGTWRLWDAGVGWSQLQPSRDTWDFRRLDLAISVAKKHGYELLYTIGRTPAWASGKPAQKSFYGPGEAAPPENMADFARFVHRVAARNAGKIRLYEVWNEPASSGMFSGTVAQMVEMTRIVDESVAKVDPTAQIVCPSPAKHESLAWFRRFLAAGGAQYCDIIGYHFYTDSGQPEDKLKLIQAVKSLLKEFDVDSKPLWDTESGHAIGVPRYANSESASAAAHVARWLILNWVSGVSRFYWYSWDHDRLGFLHPNGALRTSAWTAYQQVQSWMLGARFRSCESKAGLWSCDLRLPDNREATIYWTEDNISRSIQISPHSRVMSIDGESRILSAGRLDVAGDPKLILSPGP